MSKQKISSYEAALTELQTIVEAVESEDVGVDELATKVERAAALIKYCQTKLRSTEDAVNQTLANL
ncbi:MAG: exodeoxyribonuclease VII small subunit [Chitinophagales bacterium]